MQELDDNALLREYVERNSEEAFATLVTRHVNKVYSVALRHTRNPAQAEEITQAVFVLLARKSRQLGRGVILSGWLYQTARLTAVTFIRGEIRRARREQEAHMQNILNENEPEVWTRIAPMLDSAMGELNEGDRHAVVLRYFDGKTMREVGGALGASEDAAKKRVNRAVDKLQKFFRRRGVDSTTSTLTGVISAHSVQAAPATLAKLATAAAIAKGGALSGSTLALIKGVSKAMAWAKVKFAVAMGAGALLAAGGGAAIYEIHHNLQRNDDASGGAMALPSGPANLTLKWIVGKKYPMRMELHQVTETPLPGQPQPMKMDTSFAQNFDITPLRKLDNGGWQLEWEFEKVTMSVAQQGQTILSFDSGADAAGGNNPAAAILGAHLEFFTDARGTVEKVEGVDDLMQRISGSGKSQEQAIFKQMFGEETLKQYVSFGDAFPDRMVSVGESWPLKKEIGTAAGLMTVNVKYTFKDWEQHNGRICTHSKSTGDFSTKSVSAMMGAAMEIKKAKIVGDVWFDPKAGMITELDSDQTIDMKLTSQAQTFTPQVRQSVRVLLLDGQ